MTIKQQTRLQKSYEKFYNGKGKKGRKNLLHFLRFFMPEIIFRTTKLEGEKVTRRMTSSLFTTR